MWRRSRLLKQLLTPHDGRRTLTDHNSSPWALILRWAKNAQCRTWLGSHFRICYKMALRLFSKCARNALLGSFYDLSKMALGCLSDWLPAAIWFSRYHISGTAEGMLSHPCSRVPFMDYMCLKEIRSCGSVETAIQRQSWKVQIGHRRPIITYYFIASAPRRLWIFWKHNK